MLLTFILNAYLKILGRFNGKKYYADYLKNQRVFMRDEKKRHKVHQTSEDRCQRSARTGDKEAGRRAGGSQQKKQRSEI
jgi:hypothetical protein